MIRSYSVCLKCPNLFRIREYLEKIEVQIFQGYAVFSCFEYVMLNYFVIMKVVNLLKVGGTVFMLQVLRFEF